MKRRRWLWLLLALACFIIVLGVSELIGISTASIFGWGALGALGVVALIILFAILAGFAFPIAMLVRLLAQSFVSNRENLSWILGILGSCIILVGYILTTIEFEWSLFIIMVGFFIGFSAGEEYQRFSDLRKEEETRQG